MHIFLNEYFFRELSSFLFSVYPLFSLSWIRSYRGFPDRQKKELQNTEGSARAEKRIGGKDMAMKDGKREHEIKPGMLSASMFYFFPETGCFKGNTIFFY
jgi:hypothetical protein